MVISVYKGADNMDRLQQILKTMDIPESRKTDMHWLMRNIAIRNSESPDFREAVELIIKQYKSLKGS